MRKGTNGWYARPMELRRIARAVLLAPKRFLDWVYAIDAPSGPTRSEALTHLHASGAGHDSSRWLQIEEDERRARKAELRRLRTK